MTTKISNKLPALGILTKLRLDEQGDMKMKRKAEYISHVSMILRDMEETRLQLH